MICLQCGKEYDESAAFCGYCGTSTKQVSKDENNLQSVQTHCINCGLQLAESSSFCSHCGTRVGEVAEKVITKSTATDETDNIKTVQGKIIVWSTLILLMITAGVTLGYQVTQNGWQLADWFNKSTETSIASETLTKTESDTTEDVFDERSNADDMSDYDWQDMPQQSMDEGHLSELEILIEIGEDPYSFIAKKLTDGGISISEAETHEMMAALDARLAILGIDDSTSYLELDDENRIRIRFSGPDYPREITELILKTMIGPFNLTIRDAEDNILLHGDSIVKDSAQFIDHYELLISVNNKQKLKEIMNEVNDQPIFMYFNGLKFAYPVTLNVLADDTLSIYSDDFVPYLTLGLADRLNSTFPLKVIETNDELFDLQAEIDVNKRITVETLIGTWEATKHHHMYWVHYVLPYKPLILYSPYDRYKRFSGRLEFIPNNENLEGGVINIYEMHTYDFEQNGEFIDQGHYQYNPATQTLILYDTETEKFEQAHVTYYSEDIIGLIPGLHILTYLDEYVDDSSTDFSDIRLALAAGLEDDVAMIIDDILDEGEFYSNEYVYLHYESVLLIRAE